MFSAPIGTVHPAGGSATQRTARQNTTQRGYRQQIIATRQIQQRQQPQILSNPRQDVVAVQRRVEQQRKADVRAQHIAIQQVRMVQDQNPNPAKANHILYGQAVQKIRQANDIGRLTKIAGTTSVPLQHRVGALRALRSRYGIPVTQQNFKAFRQAQAFHEFLHNGKEGDTFDVPTVLKGQGLTAKRNQTYQLRKVGGELQPVAVFKDRTLVDVVTGKKPHYFAERDKLAGARTGLAQLYHPAVIDSAHYGAKLIPEGKVGTPIRRGIAELAALGPNTITGLYGLGAAGVQAAAGNTQAIKAMGKSFSEDDPIGRLLTHGDFEGFKAHPGIALAEILGGVKALDNVAGRVSRGGGFRRPSPPDIRSTRTAPYTRLSRQDRYSKGYVTSRIQKARDAKVAAKFNDLRSQARAEAIKGKKAHDAGDLEAANGHMQKAKSLAADAERYNANRVRETTTQGPHRALTGDLERLGDVTEGTNQFAQRAGRNEIESELLGKHAIREKNRKAPVVLKDSQAEVQGLVAEGRVAPNRGELDKMADRLAGQEKFLHDHHEIATNRNVVASIREVLRTHSDDQLRLLGDDARRYARINVGVHDEAKAHDLITEEEASMSSAKPFAVEQMGARPNGDGKLVVARNGEEHVLTLDEIHKAMNAYADKHPGALRPGEQAFISHSSRVSGPGSFNIRADTAKGLSRARRTGAAVVYGTASVGREAMIGSAVKLRNMTTAVKSFRHMVENAAARDPNKVDPLTGNARPIQGNTAKEALKRYNEINTDDAGLPIPGFVEGVAVRMNPFGGRGEQLERTLFEADQEGFLPGQEHPITETVKDALLGKDVGKGPWTVLPKPYVDRLIEHSKVSGGGSPFFRSLTNAFRHTVLPFSPTWLAGNAIESVGRAAVAGWRPGDSQFEQKVIDEWAKKDPEAARRFVLSIGTGHLGSVNRIAVRATANSLGTGPLKIMRQVADKALAAEKAGKPIRFGADMVKAYTNWMLDSVNGTMESAIKGGMVGTQMRHVLPADLPAKTEAAVRHVAGELHSNPAAVEELLGSIQRAYGVYEHQTPGVRRLLTAYTPFGAWLINATNFVFHVLPADHPGLVALAAATNSATLQYRRDNGLDATLAGEKDSGQVPPFLQGSIPTPAWYARLVGADPGAPLRLARYTPLGIMTDPTSSIASAFLPQIPLNALQGTDFTGRPLRNSDGTPFDDSQKAGYFTWQLGLATVPIVGMAIRVGQKGPGALNPFQPVARKDKTTNSSSGGLPAFGAAGGGGSSSSGGLPAFKP